MKNKRLVAESLMILCYIFVLYHLSALCRYGGVKRHLLWMLLGLLVFCATLIYLLITDTPKCSEMIQQQQKMIRRNSASGICDFAESLMDKAL